jgi:Fe-S cluster biosynthesis and repair protein YggX
MHCEIIALSVARKTMPERTVFCVKLQKELPGLDEPPFDTELGKRLYENVSRQAWNMWTEHCKMLLNEYRLNPSRREDQEVIVKQLEQFFFGEGSALPKEYIPPSDQQK